MAIVLMCWKFVNAWSSFSALTLRLIKMIPVSDPSLGHDYIESVYVSELKRLLLAM